MQGKKCPTSRSKFRTINILPCKNIMGISMGAVTGGGGPPGPYTPPSPLFRKSWFTPPLFLPPSLIQVLGWVPNPLDLAPSPWWSPRFQIVPAPLVCSVPVNRKDIFVGKEMTAEVKTKHTQRSTRVSLAQAKTASYLTYKIPNHASSQDLHVPYVISVQSNLCPAYNICNYIPKVRDSVYI